jgi:fructose transport system permease protein
MIMVLSSALMAGLAAHQGLHPLLAFGAALLVCALFGAFNGSLITFVRLPPLIVTLGTYNIVFALIRIYTTQTIIAPDSLLFFGQTFKIGNTAITYGSVLMFVMFLIAWFILRSTTAGRNLYAMGDNPEAARLAGINTARLTIGIYTVAALMYGIAGLLLAARTGVGDPNAGQNANLDSITAVVLGGTSTLGGRGNIMGTLVGVLIVGVFRNGLQLMGVDSIYQVLITGILFIAAVSIDQLSHRGSK